MTGPELLDAYSCAGGAGYGYHLAGFDVTGLDKDPQPHYPFAFVQRDALEALADRDFLARFDVIHASPPCQDHTRGGSHPVHGTGWMLAATRERLIASGLPWVIENVPGSPMRADFDLCGRLFDLSLPGMQLGAADAGSRHRGERSRCGRPVITPARPSASRATAPLATPATSSAAIRRSPSTGLADGDSVWMNRDELSQAIPPPYTSRTPAAPCSGTSPRERAA